MPVYLFRKVSHKREGGNLDTCFLSEEQELCLLSRAWHEIPVEACNKKKPYKPAFPKKKTIQNLTIFNMEK